MTRPWWQIILRRFFADVRASAIVELALITPLALVILAGGFEFTRYSQVQGELMQLGASIAQSMDAACFFADPVTDQIGPAVARIAKWIDPDEVKITIFNIVRDGASQYSVNWSWASSTPAPAPDAAALFDDLIETGESAFFVDVEYAHQPSVATSMFNGATLRTQNYYFPLASPNPRWGGGDVICSI